VQTHISDTPFIDVILEPVMVCSALLTKLRLVSVHILLQHNCASCHMRLVVSDCLGNEAQYW
jgi:hypothetical protein